MSKALVAFESSIRDAEELLAHFDAQPKPPPLNTGFLSSGSQPMYENCAGWAHDADYFDEDGI